MPDFEEILERQARWQRSLRDLPWPEKVRMAAALREAVEQLRRAPGSSSGSTENRPSGPETPRVRE